ncbi:unnamed protein product [Spirodela intermedia]|uniref:Uncharacterized protein n=1 Tax=Spirodela intermedia TaxID=51605 RepID=A0A7I8LHB6_SPIIN|nr:unnamed protein product [Spirodela intermedia]
MMDGRESDSERERERYR